MATPHDRIAVGVRRRAPLPGIGPNRRRLVVALAAAVTVSAGAAAYAFFVRDVAKPLNVACFASADLQGRIVVRALDDRPPADICAAAWRDGLFGGQAVPAPPLTPCVLDSGVVGVFPSDPSGDTCTRLGLAPPATAPPVFPANPSPSPTPTRSAASALTELRDSLVVDYLTRRCVVPDEAVAFARQEIVRLGLTGWTVIISPDAPPTAEHPCASFGFDQEGRRVLLVGVPPRS